MYGYVGGEPQYNTDRRGQFIDILADIGFIGYDLYSIISDNLIDNCDNLDENLAALGLDAVGALTPGVTGLGAAYRASRIAKAEARTVRIGGRLPNARGVVRKFTLESDGIYYRVFTSNRTGSFLTKVPPKSSAFAREALSLPPENQATFIQKVLVPEGTSLLRSRAAPLFGRSGGAEQFELLNRIPDANFGPGVPLP